MEKLRTHSYNILYGVDFQFRISRERVLFFNTIFRLKLTRFAGNINTFTMEKFQMFRFCIHSFFFLINYTSGGSEKPYKIGIHLIPGSANGGNS